jgi:hypothetical protein
MSFCMNAHVGEPGLPGLPCHPHAQAIYCVHSLPHVLFMEVSTMSLAAAESFIRQPRDGRRRSFIGSSSFRFEATAGRLGNTEGEVCIAPIIPTCMVKVASRVQYRAVPRHSLQPDLVDCVQGPKSPGTSTKVRHPRVQENERVNDSKWGRRRGRAWQLWGPIDMLRARATSPYPSHRNANLSMSATV